MNALRAYARTQNETAGKERLMVLLFEAALKHMRTGKVALEQGRRRDGVFSLTRASDIVGELLGTLDTSKAPELCKNLQEIYTFVIDRLIASYTSFDPRPAHEAERAFAPIVDAFSQAVASLEGKGVAAR